MTEIEPLEPGNEEAVGRCATCKYWNQYKDEIDIRGYGNFVGSCSCDAFTYVSIYDRVKRDGLGYWDYEACQASFCTGEYFGCIHWQQNNLTSRD